MNLSFDQSLYMENRRNVLNDSMRGIAPNSAIVADQKLKTNQYADFSMLLSELNNWSGNKNKKNAVPYYLQNRNRGYETKGRSDDCDEGYNNCLIFWNDEGIYKLWLINDCLVK
jgi:hypothetical protein